jgi:archaellum biogenesis protein FlaJ (TadC family)
MTTFDNEALAFISIFQTITAEGWTHIMDIYSDSYTPIVTQLVFVACVIICSFFILNLTVATMLDKYAKMEADAGGDSEHLELLV